MLTDDELLLSNFYLTQQQQQQQLTEILTETNNNNNNNNNEPPILIESIPNHLISNPYELMNNNNLMLQQEQQQDMIRNYPLIPQHRFSDEIFKQLNSLTTTSTFDQANNNIADGSSNGFNNNNNLQLSTFDHFNQSFDFYDQFSSNSGQYTPSYGSFSETSSLYPSSNYSPSPYLNPTTEFEETSSSNFLNSLGDSTTFLDLNDSISNSGASPSATAPGSSGGDYLDLDLDLHMGGSPHSHSHSLGLGGRGEGGAGVGEDHLGNQQQFYSNSNFNRSGGSISSTGGLDSQTTLQSNSYDPNQILQQNSTYQPLVDPSQSFIHQQSPNSNFNIPNNNDNNSNNNKRPSFSHLMNSPIPLPSSLNPSTSSPFYINPLSFPSHPSQQSQHSIYPGTTLSDSPPTSTSLPHDHDHELESNELLPPFPLLSHQNSFTSTTSSSASTHNSNRSLSRTGSYGISNNSCSRPSPPSLTPLNIPPLLGGGLGVSGGGGGIEGGPSLNLIEPTPSTARPRPIPPPHYSSGPTGVARARDTSRAAGGRREKGKNTLEFESILGTLVNVDGEGDVGIEFEEVEGDLDQQRINYDSFEYPLSIPTSSERETLSLGNREGNREVGIGIGGIRRRDSNISRRDSNSSSSQRNSFDLLQHQSLLLQQQQQQQQQQQEGMINSYRPSSSHSQASSSSHSNSNTFSLPISHPHHPHYHLHQQHLLQQQQQQQFLQQEQLNSPHYLNSSTLGLPSSSRSIPLRQRSRSESHIRLPLPLPSSDASLSNQPSLPQYFTSPLPPQSLSSQQSPPLTTFHSGQIMNSTLSGSNSNPGGEFPNSSSLVEVEGIELGGERSGFQPGYNFPYSYPTPAMIVKNQVEMLDRRRMRNQQLEESTSVIGGGGRYFGAGGGGGERGGPGYSVGLNQSIGGNSSSGNNPFSFDDGNSSMSIQGGVTRHRRTQSHTVAGFNHHHHHQQQQHFQDELQLQQQQRIDPNHLSIPSSSTIRGTRSRERKESVSRSNKIARARDKDRASSSRSRSPSPAGSLHSSIGSEILVDDDRNHDQEGEGEGEGGRGDSRRETSTSRSPSPGLTAQHHQLLLQQQQQQQQQQREAEMRAPSLPLNYQLPIQTGFAPPLPPPPPHPLGSHQIYSNSNSIMEMGGGGGDYYYTSNQNPLPSTSSFPGAVYPNYNPGPLLPNPSSSSSSSKLRSSSNNKSPGKSAYKKKQERERDLSPSNFSQEGGESGERGEGGGISLESKTTAATIEAAMKRRAPGTEAKFKCEFCGETFTRRYNLKGHERAHRNEKPFACTFENCDKAFARKHDLRRHAALHLGVKKYHCDPCGREFIRLDAVQRHHRTEVGQVCVESLRNAGVIIGYDTTVDSKPNIGELL